MMNILLLLTVVLATRQEEASWSGPAMSVAHVVFTIDDEHEANQPPMWLTLHLFYTDVALFEYQVNRSAAAGIRPVCICFTIDASTPGVPDINPW